MKKLKHWMAPSVLEYIQNNQQDVIDSVDVVVHFKTRTDITLRALMELVVKGYVKRINIWGFRYKYVTI